MNFFYMHKVVKLLIRRLQSILVYRNMGETAQRFQFRRKSLKINLPILLILFPDQRIGKIYVVPKLQTLWPEMGTKILAL